MSASSVAGIILIGIVSLVAFSQFLKPFGFLALIIIIILLITRGLAMLYWHGKDKGEW